MPPGGMASGAGRWARRAAGAVAGGWLGLWGFAVLEARAARAELAGAVAAAEEACGTVAREVRRRPGERALREKQRAMEKHLAEGRRALSLADEQVSRAWSCLSPLSPK